MIGSSRWTSCRPRGGNWRRRRMTKRVGAGQEIGFLHTCMGGWCRVLLGVRWSSTGNSRLGGRSGCCRGWMGGFGQLLGGELSGIWAGVSGRFRGLSVLLLLPGPASRDRCHTVDDRSFCIAGDLSAMAGASHVLLPVLRQSEYLGSRSPTVPLLPTCRAAWCTRKCIGVLYYTEC